MRRTRSPVVRWTLGGFTVGLVFPLLALLVARTSGEYMSLRTMYEAQPVMWVANIAPVLLAAIGGSIGVAHSHIASQHAKTAAIAERVAREWTNEIHDNNVEVARTAALQTKYFASLSHNMRTPLTAIIGFSELIQLDAEDGEGGAVGEIHTCAHQLLGIVNDLMDAAKMESATIELQIDDIDADAIAQEVMSHLVPLADEAELELKIDLGTTGPARADPQRLRQILINLISNAIKYTAQGSVTLRSFSEGDVVVFELEDTGAGISEEDMPKVFTAFEQTDAGKSRSDSTGLGLPISLAFAHAMGGTIDAVSAGESLGSTFRLELPAGPGGGPELCMASLGAMAA